MYVLRQHSNIMNLKFGTTKSIEEIIDEDLRKDPHFYKWSLEKDSNIVNLKFK